MAERSSYHPVEIYSRGGYLRGELSIPPSAVGTVVICREGSELMLDSSRNVTMRLNARRIASLLVNLLTEDEQRTSPSAGFRDDLERPTTRIATVIDWLRADPSVGNRPIGLYSYGNDHCGAASLIVAAERPGEIAAVAMRCGRPDRAGKALGQMLPPTLLIVGEDDVAIQRQNKDAYRRLRTDRKHLELVEGASHGFPEPDKAEEAAVTAVDWFEEHLSPVRRRAELR